MVELRLVILIFWGIIFVMCPQMGLEEIRESNQCKLLMKWEAKRPTLTGNRDKKGRDQPGRVAGIFEN